MPRRSFLLPALALIGAVLFCGLLVRLLLLRYERGDIYPAYSTMRADPLGTRAYYEALESIDSYHVIRGFTSLTRQLREKPDTLFYLGVDKDGFTDLSKDEIAQLDAYVKAGGRVVMTFKPEDPISKSSDEEKKKEEKKKKAKEEAAKKNAPDKNSPEKTSDDDADKSVPQTQQEKYERDELRKENESADRPKNAPPLRYHRSLPALWGFGWDAHHEVEHHEKKESDDHDYFGPPPPPDDEKPEVWAVRSGEMNLEPNVPWKSALYFVRLEPEWQTLYQAKSQPVLVRRTLGKGEIILATDSFPVSNEALRDRRRPAFLSFLAGPPGRLLFDETHLGTQEQEGIMYLAEKFRLEGYLYGMLGVVLLFLWRNSAPLVPPRPSAGRGVMGGAVSGKDSRSGLVNLLRRNVPVSEILKTSFAEWSRNVTPARRHLHGKKAAMESVLSATPSANAEQIVQSYHQLREINTPGHAKGNYATKP